LEITDLKKHQEKHQEKQQGKNVDPKIRISKRTGRNPSFSIRVFLLGFSGLFWSCLDREISGVDFKEFSLNKKFFQL
jgi:hypothetical protein